jgi:hypothetical protein
MKHRNTILSLALAAGVVAAAAPASQADHDRGYRRDDYYRSSRYHRSYRNDEQRRRDLLRERLFDLSDRVRLADRQGRISSRDADRLFRRLDYVRDFLVSDHELSDREFRRRMDDLDNVAEDLRREFGRYRGYDRYRR